MAGIAWNPGAPVLDGIAIGAPWLAAAVLMVWRDPARMVGFMASLVSVAASALLLLAAPISAGQLASTVTGETVNGIPTTGGTIYVRLWTMLNGIWQYHDYTYIAANLSALASNEHRSPSSIFTGSSVTFTWTPGRDRRQ